MTVDTLSPKQAEDVVKEGDIVNGEGQLNVTGVTGTRPGILTASSTSDRPNFSMLDMS